MMKIAVQIANGKKLLEDSWGKEKVSAVLAAAKAKIAEIQREVPEATELDIINLNIKLAKTSEAKAIWALCLGE
ncbi:MAG: hypothetical protein AMQ22_00030 [Candidatus Methanofastidiosum methylothiophilum]|uniref:Uncharacterized protein n=1 Tax=Candidatus Methanofastidiosum methylothiophilum TaxID=1705564 RepID=A0A150J9E9_9EURY|nr:MAG: hypothetical protein AMQ22_00030 [Candidatus Methanofastidiosum methylthiophilus]